MQFCKRYELDRRRSRLSGLDKEPSGMTNDFDLLETDL